MNLNDLFEKITQTATPERMVEQVQTMWENNKWSNFSGYRETAAFVLETLRTGGIQAESIDLPADGETVYGDAVMPFSWDCEDAVIEVDENFPSALSNLKEAPNLVGMWSPSTPEEGIQAEMVYAPNTDPAALEMLDVRGKMILTHGRFDEIRPIASRLGAVGVISSWVSNPDARTALQWINTNTDQPGGWGTKKDERPLLALSISPEIGEELGRFVKEHPYALKIKIKADLSAGLLPAITAVIPGENDREEILLLSPLYGQGANHNAVGASALLETARLLMKLIEDGSLSRPFRSIRFVFIPRVYGSLAFAHLRKEILDRTRFALCLETGAGNPDISWSRWSYRSTPVCGRHFSDGLGWQICQKYLASYRPQRFIEKRSFALSADVYFNDPAIGVPTHWLTGGTSEECRNNSEDTPDKVDPRSCLDLAAAASAVAYVLADAGLQEIPQLAYWNYSLSEERLREDIQFYLERVDEAASASELREILHDAKRHFPLRVSVESKALESLAVLDENAMTAPEWDCVHELLGALDDDGRSALELIQSYLESRAQLLGSGDSPITPDAPPPAAVDGRIPQRTGKAIGTITLDNIPYSNWTNPIKRSPRMNVPYILSWWLSDGKRTVGEIEELLRLECGRFRECIPAWFSFLEKHGYVVFNSQPNA